MLEPLKQFRKRVNDGEVVFGPSLTLADPEISAILAPSSDFMWYDLEHGRMSEEALRAHVHISHGFGKMCIVRVPDGATATIKPILDGGVDSILVPQVRSARQVRAAVADCRYPPRGTRGLGPRAPVGYGRIDILEYAAQADENIFTWVMIEHCDAIDDLDNILAIEDLNGIVIGPMDLSASYGLMGKITHPTVDGAIGHAIKSARQAGKIVGVGWGDQLQGLKEQFLDRGVQLVQLGCDFMYMTHFWQQIAGPYREKLKGFRVS